MSATCATEAVPGAEACSPLHLDEREHAQDRSNAVVGLAFVAELRPVGVTNMADGQEQKWRAYERPRATSAMCALLGRDIWLHILGIAQHFLVAPRRIRSPSTDIFGPVSTSAKLCLGFSTARDGTLRAAPGYRDRRSRR